MKIPIETFKQKYPKPKQCHIPDEEWFTPLGYCWGYAITMDAGEVWDDRRCDDCETQAKVRRIICGANNM